MTKGDIAEVLSELPETADALVSCSPEVVEKKVQVPDLDLLLELVADALRPMNCIVKEGSQLGRFPIVVQDEMLETQVEPTAFVDLHSKVLQELAGDLISEDAAKVREAADYIRQLARACHELWFSRVLRQSDL